MSISQFNPKQFERGLICAPNTVPLIEYAIARVDPIRFFKQRIQTNSKFHISIGHKTVLAQIHCFHVPNHDQILEHESTGFQVNKNKNTKKKTVSNETKENEKVMNSLEWKQKFNWDLDYVHLDELITLKESKNSRIEQYVLLQFTKKICTAENSFLIGSRFDSDDIHSNKCRIAFSGRLVAILKQKKEDLKRLRVYKPKIRKGITDRVVDDFTIIGRGFFKKGTDINLFCGLKIELGNAQIGIIENGYGDAGKFYAKFKEKLPIHSNTKKWHGKIYLKSRKFIFQKSKQMTQ